MEPRTLPQRFCEAKRAEEERTEHAEACPMRSETLRDSQKASPRASGSALEALELSRAYNARSALTSGLLI